ncbi:hypothetical protein NDU88_007952 [Pleurodeles waltl]|uniref:Uncharacterized protein n=1 Tax=Pleurodeles waltl TaxID=8319 RepID=A0AAV7PND4_PLEWA|nr:hypothetical protein NDU88_007952 [Pleurodeles waltl]
MQSVSRYLGDSALTRCSAVSLFPWRRSNLPVMTLHSRVLVLRLRSLGDASNLSGRVPVSLETSTRPSNAHCMARDSGGLTVSARTYLYEERVCGRYKRNPQNKIFKITGITCFDDDV